MNVAPENWRCKDVLVSCDRKVITLLAQWRCPLWTSIKELFLLHRFDNSRPSVTRDEGFVKVT